MQALSTPLVAAAAAFLVVVLWRVRPAMPFRARRRAPREALREAQSRIEASATPAARALALCDAADLLTRGVGGASSATGFYLRAMRTDPQSAAVGGRAGAGLAAPPRAPEAPLWRPPPHAAR